MNRRSSSANDDPSYRWLLRIRRLGGGEQRENFESSGMMGVEQESALVRFENAISRSAVADAFTKAGALAAL